MVASGSQDGTPAGLTASIELVERARAGDHGALERLFERYYPRVRRVVRARMGLRLRALEAPEDIVQNTFIAALGSLGRFEVREDADLIDWFSRLVENQLSDAAKYHGASKRDSLRKVSLDALQRTSSAEVPTTPEPSAPDVLSFEEQARILDECISELAPDHREAIVLRDHAAASWVMVAERLGRPSEAAARELYRRAQVRLMDLFRRRAGS